MTRIVLLLGLSALAWAAELPKLRPSGSGRFLVTASGQPFFYLGDTAWELFHRLTREEVREYLDIRNRQGFTVIQAVGIAEFDGLTEPNRYGELPLADRNPLRPVDRYWDYVAWVIDEANQRGMYVGLLPTWARYVVKQNKDDEPIFTVESAQKYGEYLGRRFRNKGVIWILGGDRTAEGVEDIWRAMAKGIVLGLSGREDYSAAVFLFHPRGGTSSSKYFPITEPWLTVQTHQTGHGTAEMVQPWAKIAADYERTPPKPIIDAEPLYEDHPIAFRSKQYGYSFDAHVRQRIYWDLFSGACGVTYGNHAMWQFFAPGRKPVNGPLMDWREAIERPGARQVHYAKMLIESRPVLSRVPDQTLITDELTGADHISATRGDGYAFIYTAQGRAFTVNADNIPGQRLRCWWFNP
ncbi:MAG: glycoside hydrolase family 140 protein, partial [Acidobacteriaceae bacterium]|nr:glycoside hydrolase family 140 protein [Acidobacteriaceae bacterium]